MTKKTIVAVVMLFGVFASSVHAQHWGKVNDLTILKPVVTVVDGATAADMKAKGGAFAMKLPANYLSVVDAKKDQYNLFPGLTDDPITRCPVINMVLKSSRESSIYIVRDLLSWKGVDVVFTDTRDKTPLTIKDCDKGATVVASITYNWGSDDKFMQVIISNRTTKETVVFYMSRKEKVTGDGIGYMPQSTK